MSARLGSRCLGLTCRHRLFSTARVHSQLPEVSPASGSSEGPRRSLDVSKIWQAQGNDGKGKSIGSNIESAHDTLEKCPDPQCPCAPTPAMPEGLPIDTTSKMTMPYYDRHILIGVQVEPGTDPHALAEEWPSKIESDLEHPATILKAQLGPKGKHYRPDFAVSITASTLSSLDSLPTKTMNAEEFWLFPDFARVRVRREHIGASQYPSAEDSTGVGLTAVAKAISTPIPLQRQADTEGVWSYESITKPVVLICGHGSRDKRCGILGPLLLSEFEKHVGATGDAAATAHVGLVSHIGGHKWAGNVIIYAPPVEGRAGSSVGGKAVWYGRVEPRHVEGIVEETIGKGRVIGELLRGVHTFTSAVKLDAIDKGAVPPSS